MVGYVFIVVQITITTCTDQKSFIFVFLYLRKVCDNGTFQVKVEENVKNYESSSEDEIEVLKEASNKNSSPPSKKTNGLIDLEDIGTYVNNAKKVTAH